MKKPHLNKVPFPDFGTAGLTITMSVGQRWDVMLDEAYKIGATILELDDNENPVAAYRKEKE